MNNIDPFNRKEISSEFPYDEIDGEKPDVSDIERAAEMLTLVLQFLAAGRRISDIGTRALTMIFLVRPDLLEFEKLEDVAKYSGKGVGRQAIHNIAQEFKTLTGFSSIMGSEAKSQSKRLA
jgi:hypothetical protein